MKVTNEKTENRQAFLTVEMEPAEVEASLEKSYQRLVRRANIPGFRRGRAPREIVERYLGKEHVFEEALNGLLPEAYEKAVKEQNIEPFAPANIELVQTEPVIFKAVVPLAPVVKLGDYHHIEETPESVKLSDDDTNAAMEQLRHQHATWEPAERKVEHHDLVVMDIESTIDGQPFISRKGTQYQVLSELTLPAPGFAEQLVGISKGEEKEFKLQFPADYRRKELAGKEPSFKVKVLEVKQEKLPDLNDDFAKEVNPEFANLEVLREKAAAELKSRAEEKARLDFEEKVIEAVVKTAELEYPPVLVESEIDRLIDQQVRYWQTDDKGLEAYLGSINKTKEELREDLRPAAIKNVTQSLVLGKVAEEEKIEVEDAEIHAEIDRMVQNSKGDKDEMARLMGSPQAHRSVEQILISRKTVQRLVDIAQGAKGSGKIEEKEVAK